MRHGPVGSRASAGSPRTPHRPLLGEFQPLSPYRLVREMMVAVAPSRVQRPGRFWIHSSFRRDIFQTG